MRILCRHVLVLVGLALSFQACAGQGVLAGVPPYTAFEPHLNVFPQNFGIAEDGHSIVYIGNYDGVMTFDGERWHLVRMPNHEAVRSLAYDGHNRVYVGGYNDFGYIDHNDAGRPAFHDLLPAFRALIKKPRFEDVWDVRTTSQGVFFGTLKTIFFYDPRSGEVKDWHYAGRFGAMVNYDGSVVVQFRGEGLKIYRHGKWSLLPGSEAFKSLVYALIPLDSGGLVALSSNSPWREYVHKEVRPFTVPAGFPAPSHFFTGKSVGNHTLVLAADNGSLYILSANRNHYKQVHLADGSLPGLIEANDGGLLVAGNRALFHVQWPTAWTIVKEQHGLAGTLSKVVKWNGNWYVLSGSGVFRAATDRNSRATKFFRMPWTDLGAWDMLPLDKHHALLADSYNVMEISDGSAKPLTNVNLYPRVLVHSRFHRNRVYAGTESGLAVFDNKHGKWRLLLNYENMNGINVNSIVETSPDRLWIGSGRGGVRSIKLSKDGKRVVALQKYNAAEGVRYGAGVPGGDIALLPHNRLVVSTSAGEFLWSGKRFRSYGANGLEALRKPGEWFTFCVQGNRIWATSDNRIYRWDSQKDQWAAQPISQFRHGAIQDLKFLANGGAMMVTTGALLHYTPLHYHQSVQIPHVLLRSVEMVRHDGEKEFLPLHASRRLQVPEGGFSLSFRFALPDYAGHNTALFRARLAGVENQLSPWASNSIYTYSQLGAGNYSFELVGRDAQGDVSKIKPFVFYVLPPWYERGWAWIIWIFLISIAVALIATWFVRLRTRQLAAEKARLEGMVEERTLELQKANSRLLTMVNIDSLTEIPNRRRMNDYLDQVWTHCLEVQRQLSILVIDVDHFKQYNDRFGHLAGDKLLKQLVAILGRCLRRSEDLLARYGGEEFIVVLPGAASGMAYDLAERMRKEVESSNLGVTISVGLATCTPGDYRTAKMLVHEADEALYSAKAAGRNKAVYAEKKSTE